MNDKIRELAKQCRYTYESDRGVYQEFDEQKFAELLIRECALQCVHNEDMDLIEKHFGVKE